MDIKKLSLIIPAIIFMSPGVFADEAGSQPPRYEQPQQPDQGYEDDCGGGCQPELPPAYQAPCGGCGAVLPPPVIYNPGFNYACGPACLPPVLPYPQPIAPYPIYPGPIVRPIYPPVYRHGFHPGYGHPGFGRPGYGLRPGFGPGYGPRPGFGPHPGYGPRPGPRFRHMSAAGCEVQQGNNGEFTVISAEGETLFSSKIQHAQENAEYMKSYYEKTSELCGGVRSSAKSLDI